MKQKQNILFCFSPAVMIATFAIEVGLLLYAALKFRRSPVRSLTIVTLLCLATFQLAEYFVCGGLSITAATWSRVGYVAISLLPALGMHLVSLLANKKNNVLVYGSYGISLVWASLFMSSQSIFTSYACEGNYVIFKLREGLGDLYFGYYYALLLGVLWLCFSWSKGVSAGRRRSLRLLALGYSSFMIPTGVMNTLSPESTRALPSVMCGFAVLFALILTFLIVPNHQKQMVKKRSKSKRRAFDKRLA